MLRQSLRAELKKQLALASKVVLLGVGSELRGDDSVGILVVNELAHTPIPQLTVLDGGTAPENLTGEIKRLKPSHLVVVDAAELNELPGVVKLVPIEEVSGYTFSTHALPLKIMVNYLHQDLDCIVIVIAVQPGKIDFGALVSFEVKAAAKEVASAIKFALGINHA